METSPDKAASWTSLSVSNHTEENGFFVQDVSCPTGYYNKYCQSSSNQWSCGERCSPQYATDNICQCCCQREEASSGTLKWRECTNDNRLTVTFHDLNDKSLVAMNRVETSVKGSYRISSIKATTYGGNSLVIASDCACGPYAECALSGQDLTSFVNSNGNLQLTTSLTSSSSECLPGGYRLCVDFEMSVTASTEVTHTQAPSSVDTGAIGEDMSSASSSTGLMIGILVGIFAGALCIYGYLAYVRVLRYRKTNQIQVTPSQQVSRAMNQLSSTTHSGNTFDSPPLAVAVAVGVPCQQQYTVAHCQALRYEYDNGYNLPHQSTQAQAQAQTVPVVYYASNPQAHIVSGNR